MPHTLLNGFCPLHVCGFWWALKETMGLVQSDKSYKDFGIKQLSAVQSRGVTEDVNTEAPGSLWERRCWCRSRMLQPLRSCKPHKDFFSYVKPLLSLTKKILFHEDTLCLLNLRSHTHTQTACHPPALGWAQGLQHGTWRRTWLIWNTKPLLLPLFFVNIISSKCLMTRDSLCSLIGSGSGTVWPHHSVTQSFWLYSSLYIDDILIRSIV